MTSERPITSDELAALASFCPGATVIPEGGVTYVHLPKLGFNSAGREYEMEALLVPQMVAALGGYTTRLLLKGRTAKNLNWGTVTALGSSWDTWSWNKIPQHIPLIEILGNHLKALQ